MALYSQDLRKPRSRHRRAWGTARCADRPAVPGQSLLRHPAVAALPHHRLPRAQAARRRTAARVGPTQPRRRLRALIRKQPDATLEEPRHPGRRLQHHGDRRLQPREKLKITRKKKVLHAQEQDTPEGQQKRRDFLEEIAGVDPQRLVFVDESGANTAMTRTHGRAPVGERVHGAVPGHWDSITLICGLRLSGATAPVVFPGATNTAAFQSYVEQVLVPQSWPDDVVIWDNPQAAQGGGGDRRGRAGGSAGCAAAAVEPGPDADRGDVLEGQGGVAVGGGAVDGGDLWGDRLGLA